MTDKHQIADDLTTLAYPIEKLKHLDGNPRKGNVEAVKKSYKKFGQRKPIVATKDGEVISGNHQLAAAKELGWNKIAVVFTDDDELTAKAFALADNRTSDLGTYDDDLLADMLGAVSSDLEMLEATSFDEKDLMALIKKQEVIEDDAPDIRQTEIKLGQKYKLGNHTLVCGDATNKEYIDFLIKDNVIDMVFTDPPYGMFLNADFSDMKTNLKMLKTTGAPKTGGKYKQVIGDNDDFKPELIETIFNNFNCKEIFIWGFDYFTEFIPNRNDGSVFVWDKRLEEQADKMYGSCFELCWSKAKHKRDIVRIKWAGIFGTEKEFDKKRHHPTQKPIKLSSWFIDKYSKEKQNIVDIYGGSGSTLIACEQLERNCFIMELDPEYCQVIIDRWEKFTGQKAELIESL